MSTVPIRNRASFDFIRYASCWEDADVLFDGLSPVVRGGRILSIASAGDNALALLTADPKEIVAVDLSQEQLACTALRIEAFRHLDYDELLAFLGVIPSLKRGETYFKLRDSLAPEYAAFWDVSPKLIEEGIIHGGKFEKYLRLFGRYILSFVHRRKKREALLEKRTLGEQRMFYSQVWDTHLWRLLFRLFFSRKVMGLGGRDPEFFAHVQGSVAKHILSRTRYALSEISTHSNPYLTYIMTGNWRACALPRYLRPEHFETIRSRLDRIQLHHGDILAACSGEFNGFILSDIFEYMSDDETRQCYHGLLDHAAPKARLAYWNMLVPRGAPPELDHLLQPLTAEASKLHKRDKAWFYQSFHLDEVRP